jgi:hypothetical protein
VEREASDDGRQSSRFEMEPEEMRATDLVIKASTRGINSSANVDVTLSALNITGYLTFKTAFPQHGAMSVILIELG